MDLALSRFELLPELRTLEQILESGHRYLEAVSVPAHTTPGDPSLPIWCITLGNPSLDVPAVGFFGGVHGLERIGTRVLLAFLQGLVSRLAWDAALNRQLESLRLVFMPLVNPAGMRRGTRANAAGVDLMRNAPIDAVDPVPLLVGGQRFSPGLPWYRGRIDDPMQSESLALCGAVDRELLTRPFSIALDCHSGFGVRDRVWFPYAGRRAPFPRVAELHALHEIFVSSNGNHPYIVEPQSRQYLAHGDLWDHLSLSGNPARVFLPLTLEMGSWLWIRKNPRQFFSRTGLFNPAVGHREQRVLRRHLPLLDFLLRAAQSWRHWLPQNADSLAVQRRRALARWYSQGAQ